MVIVFSSKLFAVLVISCVATIADATIPEVAPLPYGIGDLPARLDAVTSGVPQLQQDVNTVL
jgi:hypothetical protein